MNFGLDRFQINRYLVEYECHAKISNFVQKFRSDTVQFGSIRVLGELISNVELGMGLVIQLELQSRVSFS